MTVNNSSYYDRLDAEHQRRIDEADARETAQAREAAELAEQLIKGNTIYHLGRPYSFDDVIERAYDLFATKMDKTLWFLYQIQKQYVRRTPEYEGGIRAGMIMFEAGLDSALHSLTWELAEGAYEREQEEQAQLRVEINGM